MNRNPITISDHWFDVSALLADKRVTELRDKAMIEDGIEVQVLYRLPEPFEAARNCGHTLDFVYCRRAPAHTDAPYADHMFASLVVAGDHDLFAARSSTAYQHCRLQPGMLFALDPRRIHWAEPLGGSRPGLLLLQWIVDRDGWWRAWQRAEGALPRADKQEGKS